MGLASSGMGTVFSFGFWLIACAVSAFVPYGLGALVPLFAILATLGDLEKTVGVSATFGTFVSLFLSAGINDQPGVALYFIAVILGIVSLFT